MTLKTFCLVGLLLLAAGCASHKRKASAGAETTTKEAVALQTTQSGTEGSDIKLDKLLETARVTPYPKKGPLQGFLLEKLKPKSPWTHAGFRNGDILIRIADQPIESRDDLMAVFYALGAKASIECEVLRKGKNVIFELNQ